MTSSLTSGLQWLGLLSFTILFAPIGLASGCLPASFGSPPLLEERGAFDLDGTPVSNEIYSLSRSSKQPKWLVTFIRRYNLDLLPSLASGVRGRLSPAAVARLWREELARRA